MSATLSLPRVTSQVPLTFKIPRARSYYSEGAAGLNAVNQLQPGLSNTQGAFDAAKAQSGLAAAQAVVPGYLDLAKNWATGAGETLRGMDPEAETLRQRILARGNEAAGSSGLSASERRDIMQRTRARFAGAGRVRGNAAIGAEAVALDRGTMERQGFNQNQAIGALSAASQFDRAGNVAQSVLADPGFANRMGALSSGGYQVDPWSSYNSDVNNTNYNAEASQLMGRHNTLSALYASGATLGRIL